MKPHQNNTEAQSHITEFLEASKCYFSFKSTGYQKEIALTILGGPLYLGQFNRIVKTKSSYTFSYIANDKIVDYKKRILRTIVQSGIDSKYFQITDNSKDVLPSTELETGINEAFLQSVFSDAFIQTNKLTPSEIESEMEINRCIQEDPNLMQFPNF
jgi:hypothetical protein